MCSPCITSWYRTMPYLTLGPRVVTAGNKDCRATSTNDCRSPQSFDDPCADSLASGVTVTGAYVASRCQFVPYSYRKAAMGSSRAAFNAGHMPKNKPMLVAMVNPATTDHRGT